MAGAAPSVVVSEETVALPETRVVCGVCARQLSKYGCPRCNRRTCSLVCYKAHSTACTELFARDNVTQAMQGLKVDDVQRRQFADLLRRVYDEQTGDDAAVESEPDDEEETDSPSAASGLLNAATLARLAASAQPRLEDLTPDEQAAFLRAVRNGSFSHLLEPWEPWWHVPEASSIALRPDGTPLVQLVAAEETEPDGDAACLLPPPPKTPLPPLASLTPGPVSPLLASHVADVLAAYAVTLRTYNGDWQGDEPGAADTLLALSPVLTAATSAGSPQTAAKMLPTTPPEAVTGVLARASSGDQTCAPHAGDVVHSDVACILTCGRGALVCALEHARRLLQDAVAEAKASGAATGVSGAIRRAERKLFFLTAWAADGSTCDAQDELREALSMLANEATGLPTQQARQPPLAPIGVPARTLVQEVT